MTVFLPAGFRHGEIHAVASKSSAQRLFICAAFGSDVCRILCGPLSADLSAMLDCLRALGAEVSYTDGCVRMNPIRCISETEHILPCGESGVTLRFLLPLAGMLGVPAAFERLGRLPERPIEPLASELRRHGMTIEPKGSVLHCSGRLHGGEWSLPGNVSSQFISSLLLSLPLLEEDSYLSVTGTLESAPYIAMTEQVLRLASIRFTYENGVYTIPGRQRPLLPEELTVEGDWSSAAPFLAMGALSDTGISVAGLNPASSQGDRSVCELLCSFGAEVSVESDRVLVRKKELHGIRFDAAQTPDLVPVIAALGALAEGETSIVRASRLREKESDRLHTTAEMLEALGAEIQELPDSLIIRGKPVLRGGNTDSFSDHRIAMAAAVAACGCEKGVTLSGAECVEKSYPRFWDDFTSLGG